MKRSILFVIMFSIAVFPLSPTWGADNVQDFLNLLERAQRQRDRQDKAIIRPTPQERGAIQKLLDISPPPKTLTSADRKFLKELEDKVAWQGFERRIMHMIYKEVYEKEIDHPAPAK